MAAVFLHGPSSTLHTCPPSPALNPLQRRLILLGGLRRVFGSPTLSLELSTRIIKGRGLQCRNIMKEFSRTRSNFLLNAKALGPDSSIWPSQRKKKRRYGGCIAARADRSADELEYSKVWKEEDAKSRKKPSQVEEELVRQFLGEGSAEVEGGNTDDFVSKVLRDKPSQVEPKYLIGDRLYTLKEKELLRMPIWKKIAIALGLQRSDKLTRDSVESAERQLVEAKREEDEVGTSGRQEEGMQQLKSVFLSDLLREYKGNLYVPEEAFKEHVPEIEGFKRSLVILPRMTFDDFLKAMRSNQVEMLTSRGIPSPSSSYVYHDFIVDLKSVPGEKSLQMRKWAMHLTEKEAKVVFGEYAGPQREVETYCTPYVAPPPSSPNPLASSISGRVMLELTVVTGLVAAVAFTAGGIAAAVAFLLASCVTVVVVHIIWPLASPFLRPLSTLFLMLMKGIGSFLFGSATGSRGLLGILSDIYRFVTFGSLFTTVRTLGAILFVAGTMGLLAKFTLTRRPKDFTKWDLWQAIEFGHSKPQARVEGSTGVLFEDVAGIDDVVEELQELVNYLKDPERFNQMGTKPPHGVLLEGPPGCGKTLLAKAIAGEAGVPFYQMAGSEFVEVLVGVGAARIRDLFKRAKVNRPSVVFIDEIDALGAMRHGGAEDEMEEYNAGAQERETTLNQLLIELDGFDTGKGVVFLGATNRMDMLDPALLRPGRFDRKVTIKPPRAKGRLDILKVHSKNVKLSPEVDLWLVAKNLPGWSGAELAQLLQEGALMAVRNGHDQILQKDLDQAMDRLNVGPERFGIGLGLPVHRRIATIEIGLAMTSHLLRRLENAELEYCERVSIVPRGETLSRTIFEHLDDEAYFFQRKHNFLHRMQVFLGGRAAEEVMFGRDTSDWSVVHLQDASWLARKLITIWNLEGPFTIHGEKAPWSNEPHFAGPPLDFEGWLYDDYELVEPSLNAGLDNEVAERTEALVRKCYNKTLMVLQHHHAALTKAIYVILEKHELFGDEIELILDSYPAGTPVDLVEDEEDPGALSLNPPSQNLAMIEDGTHTAGTPLVCIEKENVQHLETMQRGDYRRNGNEIPLSRNAEYPGKTVNGNGSGNGEARMKSLSEDSNNMEANSVGNIEGNTSISNGDGLSDATSDLSVEQTTTPARTRKQDLAD